MKLYSTAPLSSIKMAANPELKDELKKAISKYNIDIAIESGTFDGTGSTSTIADCFLKVQPPKNFITFEVGFQTWTNACQNLKKYPFVTPLWGCSIDRQLAVKFVQQDEMIKNHKEYPEIYIDDIDNPVEFYSKELQGFLNKNNVKPMKISKTERFLSKLKIIKRKEPPKSLETQVKNFLWSGEDLLSKYLELHKKNHPLVVLDSAGGCGWLEFQTTIKTMQTNPFLLLLDDTHHIKHYRSLQYIKNCKKFKIINHNPVHGWALALYK